MEIRESVEVVKKFRERWLEWTQYDPIEKNATALQTLIDLASHNIEEPQEHEHSFKYDEVNKRDYCECGVVCIPNPIDECPESKSYYSCCDTAYKQGINCPIHNPKKPFPEESIHGVLEKLAEETYFSYDNSSKKVTDALLEIKRIVMGGGR